MADMETELVYFCSSPVQVGLYFSETRRAAQIKAANTAKVQNIRFLENIGNRMVSYLRVGIIAPDAPTVNSCWFGRGHVQYQYRLPPVKESERGIGARVAERQGCWNLIPVPSTDGVTTRRRRGLSSGPWR